MTYIDLLTTLARKEKHQRINYVTDTIAVYNQGWIKMMEYFH